MPFARLEALGTALLAGLLAGLLAASAASAEAADPPRAVGVSASRTFVARHALGEVFAAYLDREPPRRTAPGDTITNRVGMKLAFVRPTGPEGFWMGSPEGEEGRGNDERRHKVTLTKGFYLGATPVTQGQWQALMGTDVRQQRDKVNPKANLPGEGEEFPMCYVSWADAREFCEKLSKKEGKHYRLPTEAQWEYACRAGTTTAYHAGNGEAALKEAGWYGGNSPGQLHPVGQKKPNAWGLYDLHASVRQWCGDTYGEYPPGDALDPSIDVPGAARVLRGGSFRVGPAHCRGASRDSNTPDYRVSDVGFRVALDAP